MQPKILVRLLLFVLTIATFALAREARFINIFDGEGGEDIIEFRNTGNKMFNALPKYSNLKWVKVNGIVPIPYRFRNRNEYGSKDLAAITEAMWRIENNTCIRFKEWEGERDFFEIQNNLEIGCCTNWGRITGKEVLHLEHSRRVRCTQTRTVQHELLHIVGLLHEHMRYDRDDFITIHFENIKPGNHSQFEKYEKDRAWVYGIPYDYTSIMHYTNAAASYNGKITIETHDPAYQYEIGTIQDASAGDYMKVCSIYDCEICMGGNDEPIRIPEVIPDTKTVAPETPTPPAVITRDCRNTDYMCFTVRLNRKICDEYPFIWEVCCASCFGYYF